MATKRWVACGGYDDGAIRFYFTGAPLRDLEIECNPAPHFHERFIREVESGSRKWLTLRTGDISHREVDAQIAAQYA